MKAKSTVYLVRGALISALYVLLTLISASVGLASGTVQFRLAEMLCILPIFFPEAVLGLFFGCFIANMLTGAVIWDVVFGALATLIGAFFSYLLRRLPPRLIFISTLPTVLANALIVPLVLIYANKISGAYIYFAATVGLGELVCATAGGTALYPIIKKYERYLKL
jgi:uncharacterized membrane protein